MRPRATALAVLALLALPATAQGADQVLYVGDSLGVGTSPGLVKQLGADAQVRGSNRIGRPSPEGLRVLRELLSPSDDVIVFDLGTNDDPSQPGRLAADLAAARRLTGERCMVVATLNRPPVNGVPVDGLNGAVLSFVDGATNVQLVDWNAVVSAESGLLAADRVHASPQGYAVRAQLFAEAVRSCGQTAARDDERAQPESEDGQARPRPRRKREREIEVPGIESSGISFTEPVEFRGRGSRMSGELLLPNVKPPYPAIVMVQGPDTGSREAFRREAEVFASRGVAALIYDRRGAGDSSGPGTRISDLAADAEAAVGVLASRDEVSRVALWAAGTAAYAAPLVAVAEREVGALVLVSPAAVAPGALEAWRVREAVDAGGSAPIATWYRMAAQSGGMFGESSRDYGFDAAGAWRAVRQPIHATWIANDATGPARANAGALRDALAEGENRDRTFTFSSMGDALLVAQVRWVRSRVDRRRPEAVVDVQLSPARSTPAPPSVNASFATAPATQAVWALAPLFLFGLAFVRGEPRRLTVAAELLGLLTLAAIAIGIADAVRSEGDVAKLAGLPAWFAVAFGLTAATAVATALLARRSAWIATAGGAILLTLALFWLL